MLGRSASCRGRLFDQTDEAVIVVQAPGGWEDKGVTNCEKAKMIRQDEVIANCGGNSEKRMDLGVTRKDQLLTMVRPSTDLRVAFWRGNNEPLSLKSQDRPLGCGLQGFNSQVTQAKRGWCGGEGLKG